MNISPHLLIDAVILSTSLTLTLVLRAKGNAARKEKNWMITKKRRRIKYPKLFTIRSFLINGSFIAIRIFLVYLYSAYIFINKWPKYKT